MASPSEAAPNLEKDLTSLLAALRTHSSDVWEGKPAQETFRVYPAPPAATTSAGRDSPIPTNLVEPADDRVAKSNSSISSSGGSVAETTEGAVAVHGSLDALMSEYVTALRGLRTSEGTNIVAKCASAGGEEEETCMNASAVADPPAAAVDEANLLSLMHALDRLPALTRSQNV